MSALDPRARDAYAGTRYRRRPPTWRDAARIFVCFVALVVIGALLVASCTPT